MHEHHASAYARASVEHHAPAHATDGRTDGLTQMHLTKQGILRIATRAKTEDLSLSGSHRNARKTA